LIPLLTPQCHRRRVVTIASAVRFAKGIVSAPAERCNSQRGLAERNVGAFGLRRMRWEVRAKINSLGRPGEMARLLRKGLRRRNGWACDRLYVFESVTGSGIHWRASIHAALSDCGE
jgi:hypothetical protein